jgi:hypothetical protein
MTLHLLNPTPYTLFNPQFNTTNVYKTPPIIQVDQQFLLSRAGAEGALAKTVEQMAEVKKNVHNIIIQYTDDYVDCSTIL